MSRLLFIAALAPLTATGCSQRFNAMQEPTEHDPWVIRTDFSNDDYWTTVRDLIAAPQKDAGREFFAYVRYVNDDKYRDKETRDLVLSLPDGYPGMFCFVVDRQCIENPEHPVLVVGFYPSDNKSFSRKPRATPVGDVSTFRALPSQIQSIQNNLSIANMGFEEFANSVGNDGVFRGFPR
jgi:hypothetical protein